MYSNFHGMFLTVRNLRMNPQEGRKTKLWSLPIYKYRRAASEEEEEEYAWTKAFDWGLIWKRRAKRFSRWTKAAAGEEEEEEEEYACTKAFDWGLIWKRRAKRFLRWTKAAVGEEEEAERITK